MYDGLDAQTRAALTLSPEALRERLKGRAEIFPDDAAMIDAFADYLAADYRAALASGRERALIIGPVGPVGQYGVLARRCVETGLSLDRLTIVIMDEYLTDAGAWIDAADPLSFRGHLRRHLLDALPEAMRPRVIAPDPRDLGSVAEAIAAHGGVDVCYAGVGITGHLAFNDPLPGVTDPDYVADLPTRIVMLPEVVRLINSVTAARGNVARIPRYAVTVGMREILGARRLRIFMNRDWQCAAIRRLACGPVTGAFPASLAQAHPNWSLHLVERVLDAPEPTLR